MVTYIVIKISIKSECIKMHLRIYNTFYVSVYREIYRKKYEFNGTFGAV